MTNKPATPAIPWLEKLTGMLGRLPDNPESHEIVDTIASYMRDHAAVETPTFVHGIDEMVMWPMVADYVISRYGAGVYQEAELVATGTKFMLDTRRMLSELLADIDVSCTKATNILDELVGNEIYDVELAEGQSGKDVAELIRQAALTIRCAHAMLRCAVHDVC